MFLRFGGCGSLLLETPATDLLVKCTEYRHFATRKKEVPLWLPLRPVPVNVYRTTDRLSIHCTIVRAALRVLEIQVTLA